MFAFSAQHDCCLAGCKLTGRSFQWQEREQTSCTYRILEHLDDVNFIMNTHALHNAHLLRRVLPRSLTEPQPLHSDAIATDLLDTPSTQGLLAAANTPSQIMSSRCAFHYKLAESLRKSQDAKRAVTQVKRKATSDANKAKKMEKIWQMEQGTSGMDRPGLGPSATATMGVDPEARRAIRNDGDGLDTDQGMKRQRIKK